MMKIDLLLGGEGLNLPQNYEVFLIICCLSLNV